MKALILSEVHELHPQAKPLALVDMPIPDPGPEEVLIKINVCGMCHTELDEIEGRTPPKCFPMILGHQAVGVVSEIGEQVKELQIGDRVGVALDIFSLWSMCVLCHRARESM